MLFNTVPFFLFLAVVLILFYASPRALRKYILLIASYYFYMSWNPKFIALLLTLTAIDYTAALMIERGKPIHRKLFLIIGLTANLGFLGFFKYFNFLADNFALLLGRPPHSFALPIILPLGISFHTFQSMSYVVDVYRGEQAAIRNPIDYALFISFFPQLVAGPIVRAREFFTDLYAWRPPASEELLRGVLLVVLGLTKKIAFADQFAQIADAYFSHPAAHPGALSAWKGTTCLRSPDLLRFLRLLRHGHRHGSAARLPFPAEFPPTVSGLQHHRLLASLAHFALALAPRLSVHPSGRKSPRAWMTYRNLMLTMLLGGLWHGASWNFVIWGGYHGALLAIERMAGRKMFEQKPPAWLYPFRAALTFGLVSIGWVFFRAATFADSRYVVSQMFQRAAGAPNLLIAPWLAWLAVFSLIAAFLEERLDWAERLPRGPAWAYAAALIVLLFVVETVGVTDKQIPFIYFQF